MLFHTQAEQGDSEERLLMYINRTILLADIDFPEQPFAYLTQLRFFLDKLFMVRSSFSIITLNASEKSPMKSTR